MISKLIYLLDELKKNYTKGKALELINCLDEVVVEDLYSKQNVFRESINGQHVNFYTELSRNFCKDLNDAADLYFFVWEPLLYFFNTETKRLFYSQALEHSANSDATDYINGLIELEALRPEIALFHFNRIEGYVASYFIGLCYLELENFENAIKNNLAFLDNFESRVWDSSIEGQDLSASDSYLLTKYNVYNDLAYCYNRLEEYADAYKYYEKVWEIFSLEELYTIRQSEKEEEDLFILDINNFLLAAEKAGNYNKALHIVDFAIAHYPHSTYYKELKKEFGRRIVNHSFADEIISQVFKPRKPFGIDKFESTKLIAREKILEDMLVEQIKYGFKVFGRELEIYQDDTIYGRQYYIAGVNGILDLLLIDKKDNIIYVIELKRNAAGVEVVNQIERYMNGLEKQLNRKIKGIICLHKPEDGLKRLVKTKDDIELFTYRFDFEQEA